MPWFFIFHLKTVRNQRSCVNPTFWIISQVLCDFNWGIYVLVRRTVRHLTIRFSFHCHRDKAWEIWRHCCFLFELNSARHNGLRIKNYSNGSLHFFSHTFSSLPHFILSLPPSNHPPSPNNILNPVPCLKFKGADKKVWAIKVSSSVTTLGKWCQTLNENFPSFLFFLYAACLFLPVPRKVSFASVNQEFLI